MGDYDNDGRLDLYISDYQDMPDRVWRNDGKGFLEEVSYEVGVGQATKNVLSFGAGSSISTTPTVLI
jgi:enediyne biosynthesis protein E4